MVFQNITVEISGAKATITINRPKALNALNRETLKEIKAAFTELENGGVVRVCIFTGAGEKACVAGADIPELKELDLVSGKEFVELGHQAFAQIENSKIVSIAAINGFALGGGCEFAMAADIRMASENAKLGQPEVNLGVIPGFGGTQRLTRLVGRGRAKELIFTARIITAEEALRIGLVEKVVPADKLVEEANKLADLILSKGPLAVQYAKEVINRGADLDLGNANGYEMTAFAALCESDDKNEGLTAFMEKRAAGFRGK
ncbi:MAG: enoyl-CoA hydratase-related protein [candidate division Zixibacteria bacterium]|nr:enoyl-CoA hydratase-related protein [candidate division Zixibacteria bacterium]